MNSSLQFFVLFIFGIYLNAMSTSSQFLDPNPAGMLYQKELALEEFKIYKMLKLLQKQIQNKDQFPLKFDLKDYEECERKENVLENYNDPIKIFRRIYRFAFLLPKVIQLLEDLNQEEIYLGLENIFQISEKFGGFPDEEDFKDAMETILRLQYLYGLDAYKLATGRWDENNQLGPKLSPENCFQLGVKALESKRYTLAHHWLTTAKNLGLELGELDLQNEIEDKLLTLQQKHDEKFELNGSDDYKSRFLFSDKISGKIESNSNPLKEMREIGLEKYSKKEYNPEDLANKHYTELLYCNGHMEFKTSSLLRCDYDQSLSIFGPFLPIKRELISADPQVYIYHKVFEDREIEGLKAAVTPDIKSIGQHPQLGHRCTIAYSYLRQKDSKSLKATAAKLLKFPGYWSLEKARIAVYSFIEDTDLHYDSSKMEFTKFVGKKIMPYLRKRFSTPLLYLNEADLGGRTILPVLKISAKIPKGSILFWFNHGLDGKPDKRLAHAGCSVLKGEKWIGVNNPGYFLSDLPPVQCGENYHTDI